jgi:hypothetical protein
MFTFEANNIMLDGKQCGEIVLQSDGLYSVAFKIGGKWIIFKSLFKSIEEAIAWVKHKNSQILKTHYNVEYPETLTWKTFRDEVEHQMLEQGISEDTPISDMNLWHPTLETIDVEFVVEDNSICISG